MLFAGWLSPLSAQADSGWDIDHSDVRLEIQDDGTLDVTETIETQFFDSKHGIYRFIPIRYTVGFHQYALRFRLLEVEDEKGQAWNKKVTYHDNQIEIRIGDADRTISG